MSMMLQIEQTQEGRKTTRIVSGVLSFEIRRHGADADVFWNVDHREPPESAEAIDSVHVSYDAPHVAPAHGEPTWKLIFKKAPQ